jgi:hypothetical protein
VLLDGASGVLLLPVAAELPLALLPGRRVVVAGDDPATWLVVGLTGASVLNVPNGLAQLDALGDVPDALLAENIARTDEAQTWTATQTMPAFITSGATPGIAAGAGAGTAPTVSIVGNNTAGAIIVTAGTAPPANANLANITFASPPGTVPRAIVLQPVAANALGSSIHTLFTSWTATGWSVRVGATALSAGLVYRWAYLVYF